MDKIKKFLKMHSVIPNEFIDEFISMNSERPPLQTEFVIDLDIIAKWLQIKKFIIVRTLKTHYKKDIDYVFIKVKKPTQSKYGGNNYKKVMLTPDCFKRLCMLSKSKKAEDVRTYYIELEALIFKYYQQTLDGMELEIKKLENELKPKSAKDVEKLKAGYIYVLKASDKHDSMYKIGRTANLKQRLSTYQTGSLEEVDITHKFKTNDLKSVENCVKFALKDMRPRKYKEIYKANVNLIKQIIDQCQEMQDTKKLYVSRKPSKMTGGYYIALFDE